MGAIRADVTDLLHANDGISNLCGQLGRDVEYLQDQTRAQGQHLDRVIEMQSRLQKVMRDEQERVQGEIEQRFENLPAQSTQSFGGALRLELPTFSGEPHERPMRFLRAFLAYCDGMNISNARIKLVLDQALKGLAREWYEFCIDNIFDRDSFRKLFVDRYWSNSIQRNIRRKLENGYYEAQNNLSRAEYVMRLTNDLRELSDPPSQQAMVDAFSRHFDCQVQDAIGVRGIVTIHGLLELLDSLDNQTGLNSTLESGKRVNFRDVSMMQHRGPSHRVYNHRDSFNNTFNYSKIQGRSSTPVREFSNENSENRGSPGGPTPPNRSRQNINIGAGSGLNQGRFQQRNPQINNIEINEVVDDYEEARVDMEQEN